MNFKNRYDAALKLIPYLKNYRPSDSVVLAVPRGGVPIGYYISKHYGFPLEVILTKKIGHPHNSELAIGAVSLNSKIIDPEYKIPEDYINTETERIRNLLRERYKKYMGDLHPADLKNKTVIIVDDGVATGNTILVTIEMIRKQHPKKIVIAVPVAPFSTAAMLKKLVDDFICLLTPADFMAVGNYYDDFGEVTDDEAIQMLKEANTDRIIS